MKTKDLDWLHFLAEIDYDHVVARNHFRPFPFKIIESKYSRAFEKGWIDYGVSLTTGWLTPKGKAELRRLRGE